MDPEDGALDLFAAAEMEGGGAEELEVDPEDRAPGEALEPPEPEVWEVSEINAAVRELLERTLPPVWVRGEVAGWTRARSGHRYFTLKDESAELRCVMWRGDAERLPADPEEGMIVRAHGSVTVYEARGSYQLIVRQLQGDGEEGLWRLAFERLRRRLELEGLLREERKRPIPRHPRAVGVVTSPSGAAFRDIVSVVGRRAPWTRLVLRGARVQGEGSAAEIARAIEALGRSGLCDVLIVGRGGGAPEDLWAFNEEEVARAIVASPIPVISAVGHEVDVTIADLVADLRAPTPSAAGEIVVQDRTAVSDALQAATGRLGHALRASATRTRGRLERSERDMGRALAGSVLPALGLRLRRSDERLARAGAQVVERGRNRLARVSGKLEALSPLAVLHRGYAMPLSTEGGVLRGRASFPAGARFTLRVEDGRIRCTSEGPEEDGDG